MSQRTKPQHTKGMPLSKNSLVLTFLSVCQKAPPWSVWPVCDTAAETPQKTRADSPAPPTKAEIWWAFKKQKKETKHGDSKYHTKQVWRVSRNCTAHWEKNKASQVIRTALKYLCFDVGEPVSCQLHVFPKHATVKQLGNVISNGSHVRYVVSYVTCHSFLSLVLLY